MLSTLNKEKVFYLVQGETGAWVTLINGHARSHVDFRTLAKKLVDLGYRVLMIDNRGSGDSPTDHDLTISDMAQDVMDIWQSLEVTSSFVLGISMGGLIAQYLALHSAIPNGLILVSTTARQDYYRAVVGEWGDDLPTIKSQLSAYVHQNFLARNAPLIEIMAKQLIKNGTKEFQSQCAKQRHAINHFKPEELALENIKIPILVIHGQDDGIISSEAADDIITRARHGRKLIYPEVGHLLLVEKSKEFFSDVLSFVQNPSEESPPPND